MTLRTARLKGSQVEPLALEVVASIAPASTLLLWLERTPGLKVIAKKSWALTDDFEAYFLYKERLFVISSPFSDLWVSMIGQPADEGLFREVESRIQAFSAWYYMLAPLAVLRYAFAPFNPPRGLLAQHEGQLCNRSKNAA